MTGENGPVPSSQVSQMQGKTSLPHITRALQKMHRRTSIVFLSGRPIGIRRASSRDDSDGQVPGLEAAFAGFAAGLVRVPADMSGAGGPDRDVTDGAEAALFGHDVSVNRTSGHEWVRPTIRGTKRWKVA